MRLLLGLSLLCACTGDIVAPVPDAPGPIHTVTPEPDPARGFTVPETQVQLLPFVVRFARLRTVTGAAAEDPMFEKLLEARTSLGDYDFAAGVQPDNTWTALRITQWVTALKPICGSMQMKQRYPDLPTSLPLLIEAAYGRASTAADLQSVNDALAGLTLTAEERRDGICVAVLSSMEFVSL